MCEFKTFEGPKLWRLDCARTARANLVRVLQNQSAEYQECAVIHNHDGKNPTQAAIKEAKKELLKSLGLPTSTADMKSMMLKKFEEEMPHDLGELEVGAWKYTAIFLKVSWSILQLPELQIHIPTLY